MNLKLFACGDFINFDAKIDFIDDGFRDIIKNSDIAICNFEAPIKVAGMRPIKKVGSHLCQDKNSIFCLKNAGFDFVSLANNHIYDYGQVALLETINELKNNKIDFVGGGLNFDEAYQPKIIEKNGVKIGLLAGCENEFGCLYERQNRGGYAWILSEKIEDNVRLLKKNVDFVILLSHAGVENIDIPIKEWRNKYKRFCDIGVDVIIGHHPHVPQAYEKYKNSLIFYSLGNFYFSTDLLNDSSGDDDSYSVIFDFNKDLKVINFEIIYHRNIKKTVSLVSKHDVNFDLEKLNKLIGEDYENNSNIECLRLFSEYYYGYYENAIDSLSKKASFLRIIKFFIKKIFYNKKEINNKNLLLLHNIRIDSHRFVVQRALSLLSERNNS